MDEKQKYPDAPGGPGQTAVGAAEDYLSALRRGMEQLSNALAVGRSFPNLTPEPPSVWEKAADAIYRAVKMPVFVLFVVPLLILGGIWDGFLEAIEYAKERE